jgi:hypothetical protein
MRRPNVFIAPRAAPHAGSYARAADLQMRELRAPTGTRCRRERLAIATAVWAENRPLRRSSRYRAMGREQSGANVSGRVFVPRGSEGTTNNEEFYDNGIRINTNAKNASAASMAPTQSAAAGYRTARSKAGRRKIGDDRNADQPHLQMAHRRSGGTGFPLLRTPARRRPPILRYA